MAKFGVLILTASPESGGASTSAMVKVDGRESLLRAVELFVNRDNVAQIVAVFPTDHAEDYKRKLSSHLMILGLKAATGGPGWREQVKAGLEKLPAEATHVIIHDGARPAVSVNDLESIMERAEKQDAIACVTAPTGPSLRIDESGSAAETMSSKTVRQLTGPLVFKRSVAEEFARSGLDAVMSRLTLVDSSPLNIRIQSERDASVLKSMLTHLPKPKAKGPLTPFEEAQW
jgi:2-C-methyl-D-erythritol 4-phosphate cytidylyltransferase